MCHVLKNVIMLVNEHNLSIFNRKITLENRFIIFVAFKVVVVVVVVVVVEVTVVLVHRSSYNSSSSSRGRSSGSSSSSNSRSSSSTKQNVTSAAWKNTLPANSVADGF